MDGLSVKTDSRRKAIAFARTATAPAPVPQPLHPLHAPPTHHPTLSSLLLSLSIPASSVPCHSIPIIAAASASDAELGPHAADIRSAALHASMTYCHPAPTASAAPAHPPAPHAAGMSEADRDLRAQDKAVALFRDSLRQFWPGYEVTMLGGPRAARQVPDPSHREALIDGKLRSCVGPSGGNADRDRNALRRLHSFCAAQHVTEVWPLSAALLMNFCRIAYLDSKGPAGGHSVPGTLRSAFVHMKIHIGLPVELDSPILYNIAPACKFNARSPASTSIYLQCFWEWGAVHAPTPLLREACRIMVIACITSLRYKELKRSRVASATALSLLVSMTKDGSHDLHVDAELEGFLGPIRWWPDFARPLIGKQYLIRDPVFADMHKSNPSPSHLVGFSDTCVEPSRGPLLVRLCYLYAGIDRAVYREVRFNARSTRHLYPNIAHALQWGDSAANETGRWAAQLDVTRPVVRLKCAQRYAAVAMRETQRRIRLRIALAVREIVLQRFAWRTLAHLPEFECITCAPNLSASQYYGPNGS